jgi:hypothetical protein
MASSTIFTAAHYTISQIKTMDEIRQFWGDDPKPNELNWMIGSTSGVHGSYATLDQIEACFKDECDCPDDEKTDDYHHRQEFTVLICRPRLVALTYGSIPVTLEELPYLRTIITRSLQAIQGSQDENLEPARATPDAEGSE